MKNYFKEHELYQSSVAQQQGINNTPGKQELDRLLHIRDNYLNPIRDKLGEPIIVSSGYRCPELNKKVGGASTSNHLTGEAVDLVVRSGNIKKLFNTIESFLKESNLPFDELLFEKSSKGSVWVHLAVRQRSGYPNRSKILYLNV